ncbi:MAG: hypothetical protein QXH66_05165 [Conexivisphaerales archaeon]
MTYNYAGFMKGAQKLLRGAEIAEDYKLGSVFWKGGGASTARVSGNSVPEVQNSPGQRFYRRCGTPLDHEEMKQKVDLTCSAGDRFQLVQEPQSLVEVLLPDLNMFFLHALSSTANPFVAGLPVGMNSLS